MIDVLLPLVLFAVTVSASADRRYVWQDSPSPGPPYTNWTTAAQVIQDAVDAAAPGDEIVVTNGVYVTGGRAVGTNVLVNRVAIDKPLMLRSVNGPQVTVIQGYQLPATTNGEGAIRCVYLADGASLSGFTLTNGATRAGDEPWPYSSSIGGGVSCESEAAAVSNCVVTGNAASDSGGGVYQGTLNNCRLSSNSAVMGGGAAGGTLNNCTLTGNSAGLGGGAVWGKLNNCRLSSNSAGMGGGAAEGRLNNCTLTGNWADYGGGASASFGGPCFLDNCTLTGNWAAQRGGGAFGAKLINCTLAGNSANEGGGAYGSTLNNDSSRIIVGRD